jgi:hypothetical protein
VFTLNGLGMMVIFTVIMGVGGLLDLRTVVIHWTLVFATIGVVELFYTVAVMEGPIKDLLTWLVANVEKLFKWVGDH